MRTPGHNLRCSWVVWGAAMEKAKSEGKSLSAVIVGFLEQYSGVTTPPKDGAE